MITSTEVTKLLDNIKEYLFSDIYHSKQNLTTIVNDFNNLLDNVEAKKIDQNIFKQFFNSLKKDLQLDAIEALTSDPAATSVEEIILTYPGFYAIFVNRLAHYLYKKKIKILPRMMSEVAHSKTGIDIHPGAQIGKYFFIDHGTGTVIGETTKIGNHVHIYQNVTLGAKSLKQIETLKKQKRHPTILNNVVIYSGATILGGKTIIGNNVVIGSNVFITNSILDNKVVKLLTNNYVIEDNNIGRSKNDLSIN